jgi:5-(carboxyamino)imidazole ribonucleotide synthase
MTRIGIFGNGQLGAMLSMAARPLSVDCEFYADAITRTCENLGQQILIGHDRPHSIAEISSHADVVTFESENVSLSDFANVASNKIFPNLQALATAQDRKLEKELCRRLEIGTAEFASIDCFDELCRAVEQLGTPCILKTRTMGYDGKGQWRINTNAGLSELRDSVNWKSNGFIVEGQVDFRREVSLISVRSPIGEIRHYPLTENLHVAGILRESTPIEDPKNQSLAETISEKLMKHLNYVGVFAVEFFETSSGLLVNEMAPRVHNSGHWTIEGAATSQFENHIRAICNRPLGSCQSIGRSKMFNIIGAHLDYKTLSKIPGANLHDYKKDARPSRKLGHVTVTDRNGTDFQNTCELVRSLIFSYSVDCLSKIARCQQSKV